MSFYRYLEDCDVHVLDCAGKVDVPLGLARLRRLSQELDARPARNGVHRLLIDFRHTEWATEEAHRELSRATRSDFGLNAENPSLRLAFVFHRDKGTVSESERWFSNDAEALAWLTCHTSRRWVRRAALSGPGERLIESVKPIFRPAHMNEAQALSKLAFRSKASWGYSPELMSLFEAELTLTAPDLTKVMVADVGKTAAGFYSLLPVSEERIELGHLFVEPTFQRSGLGRLMIADVLRRAGERGARVLEIQGDPNAAQFYERVGATRVGERESESVPGRMLPLFEIVVP